MRNFAYKSRAGGRKRIDVFTTAEIRKIKSEEQYHGHRNVQESPQRGGKNYHGQGVCGSDNRQVAAGVRQPRKKTECQRASEILDGSGKEKREHRQSVTCGVRG